MNLILCETENKQIFKIDLICIRRTYYEVQKIEYETVITCSQTQSEESSFFNRKEHKIGYTY